MTWVSCFDTRDFAAVYAPTRLIDCVEDGAMCELLFEVARETPEILSDWLAVDDATFPSVDILVDENRRRSALDCAFRHAHHLGTFGELFGNAELVVGHAVAAADKCDSKEYEVTVHAAPGLALTGLSDTKNYQLNSSLSTHAPY